MLCLGERAALASSGPSVVFNPQIPGEMAAEQNHAFPSLSSLTSAAATMGHGTFPLLSALPSFKDSRMAQRAAD